MGAEAARRTLRRLGARRVATQSVPIIFSPETARTLVGSVFKGASGDAIWRSASFLAGKLGETIAAPAITIVDDNTMLLPTGVGGFGSSPFDYEGLPSRRTMVVENGVLQEVFLVITRKANDFEEGTNFFAWACTIARFKLLELLRRRARAQSFG